MSLALNARPTLDRVFLLTALIGALAVLVQVVLLFTGGGLDGDDGGGLDGDGDAGAGDLRFLSALGLSSFFTMFGLVGLALSRQSRTGMGWSILGGVLAGLATLWGIARLFRFAAGLQSSGNINPQDALGCLGTVYLRIPAGGTGRVNVRIGTRLREMDAIHAEATELATGTPVRVVQVDRSLVVVQPLAPMEPSCPNN